MILRKTNPKRLGIILFTALVSYSLHIPLVAEAKRNQANIIHPSNIPDNLRSHMKKQPNISPRDQLHTPINCLRKRDSTTVLMCARLLVVTD